MRLQELGDQAKASRHHKLADLKEKFISEVMHIRDRLHEAEEQASRIKNEVGCASVDIYFQKMPWEMLGMKKDQLVMVESEFDDRKRVELDTIAERLGTKNRVPSAEQD